MNYSITNYNETLTSQNSSESLLATSSTDNNLKFWNLTNYEQLLKINIDKEVHL